MTSLIDQVAKSVRNFLYPPLCLHCSEDLVDSDLILCPLCLEQLDLLNCSARCPSCFSKDFSPKMMQCTDCIKRPASPLDGIAAAFDFFGPAATLIKQLKYADKPYLAEGCAAFMAAQFLRLDWPMPDLIVPVPISFSHWLVRGYNQSELLATQLSQLINCRTQSALKRKSGCYSQAGLSYKQRMQLEEANLQLLDLEIKEKTLLLIDDVMTTGSTLKRCAEALSAGFPKKIYALTFCAA